MAVGNMHQRGYPSHGMTGRHDSVISIDVLSAMCTHLTATSLMKRSAQQFSASGQYQVGLVIRRSFLSSIASRVKHITLVEAKCNSSTWAPARPMAVGNTYRRGYPSHGMTGGHDSVTSICPACHVYTSSCHKPPETLSTAVLCLRSISNAYPNSGKYPFRQRTSKTGSIEQGRLGRLYYSDRASCTRHLVIPLSVCA